MTRGFLLDTSVLSILAPGKPSPDETLAAWLREHSGKLYISAVTIAEIEQGICKLRRAGGRERADHLEKWLDALLDHGSERILPLDARTGRIAGSLSDKALATGRHPGFADVAIAATALAHELVLQTRNGKHFEPLGVPFVDPVERLPSVS
ncbi:MAG: type II toxin-antitoxin system VapC family toxin [Novosphingobium sp.]